MEITHMDYSKKAEKEGPFAFQQDWIADGKFSVI